MSFKWLLFISLIFSLSCYSSPIERCKNCHLSSEQKERFYMADRESFDAHSHGQTSCVSCHLNLHVLAKQKSYPNWAVFSKKNIDYFGDNLLYISCPPLEFTFQSKALGQKNRYTKSGLRHFLLSPLPRYVGAKSSMFPLHGEEVEELLKTWDKNLDEVPNFINDSSRIKRGRELFNQCLSCHAKSSHEQDVEYSIPLLRVGFPFLSYDYFSYKVKNGGNKKDVIQDLMDIKHVYKDKLKILDLKIPVVMLRILFFSHLYLSVVIKYENYTDLKHVNNWQLSRDNKIIRATLLQEIMPSFSHFSEVDIKSLYAYTANSVEDLKHDNKSMNKEVLIGYELYHDIERSLFKTSCIHCHSDNKNTQHTIKSVFYNNKNDFEIKPFPPHQNATFIYLIGKRYSHLQ